MQIGEVIRKYRKEKNMTQEEMANRLGVTAPAVNKWENGNSLPDILLLAPIARLLDITLDTLLTFRDELTTEEINNIVLELDKKFKAESYEEVFLWAKHKLEQYPNCEQLIWQTALILDVQRLTQNLPDSAKYENYIYDCYIRVLDSKDERLRYSAADSLFGFCLRAGQYEQAEGYLKYFPEHDPSKKIKQAQIYAETARLPEAYREYEELLFSCYQTTSTALWGIYSLTVQDGDMEKAAMLTDKQTALARLFEMGEYHELSCRLDLAAAKQDAAGTMDILERLLSSVDEICEFNKSLLYEHMKFKEPDAAFRANVKERLRKAFRENKALDFLKENERWQKLLS